MEVKLHEYKEDTSSQKTFFIELFDIGGSLSHKNSRGVFYQQVNGIILCHDSTNRKSHENLKNWLFEIVNKESGKDTVKAASFDDLDSEQFLGSCQVSYSDFHPRISQIQGNKFQFRNLQIPVLVVGTKIDLLDEKHKKTYKNQQFSKEIGAEEIFVDCRNPRSFHAGSTDAVKLSRFFDKIIEKKYYRDNSTFVDKRKFTNIQSPVESSRHTYISPFASPLGNYSNFSANFNATPSNQIDQ